MDSPLLDAVGRTLESPSSWVLSLLFWFAIGVLWFKYRSRFSTGALACLIALCIVQPVIQAPMTTDQFRNAVMGKSPSEVVKIAKANLDVESWKDDPGTPSNNDTYTTNIYAKLKDPATGKVKEVTTHIRFIGHGWLDRRVSAVEFTFYDK
jgi:hypothetical protein